MAFRPPGSRWQADCFGYMPCIDWYRRIVGGALALAGAAHPHKPGRRRAALCFDKPIDVNY